MKFHIITAFPEAFSYLNQSIPKRAVEKGIASIVLHDLRKYGQGKHKQIDDRPFGGGAGMVLQVEPLYKCLKDIGVLKTTLSQKEGEKTRIILTSPRGKTWNQQTAESYKEKYDRLVIICGHYEGVDERVMNLVHEEVSIGNFILSGGELASMIIADSIIRLLPGVVGNTESIVRETSFSDDTKKAEHPHYTRPGVFKTDEGDVWEVPKILLSGDHAKIEEWKHQNSNKVNL